MMHEDDHKLNFKSLHFIKVRVTHFLRFINHLTRTVAIIGSLIFRVPEARSYKILPYSIIQGSKTLYIS